MSQSTWKPQRGLRFDSGMEVKALAWLDTRNSGGREWAAEDCSGGPTH